MRTSSGNELASMIWPRWTLTVTSLRPCLGRLPGAALAT